MTGICPLPPLPFISPVRLSANWFLVAFIFFSSLPDFSCRAGVVNVKPADSDTVSHNALQWSKLHRPSGHTDAAQARKHYGLARDWDAMQFRADSRLNGVIRKVAAASRPGRVWLADLEEDLAASNFSEQGIPGGRLFGDHVHPVFAGNYLSARGLCAKVAEVMGADLGGAPAAQIPTPQQCAEAIGYTLYDELSVAGAMVRLTSRPPFLDQLDHAQRQAGAEAHLHQRFAGFTPEDAENCIQSYHAAIQGRFPCWPTRFNLASLCEELERYPAAAEQYRSLIGQFPRTRKFRLALALCLLKSGDKPGAEAALKEALRLGPPDKETRRAMEQIQGRRLKAKIRDTNFTNCHEFTALFSIRVNS